MDERTLERLVGSYLALPQETHTFGWQGGEPTLMGLPFFRRMVELQTALGQPGAKVANGLQTNGTLLDDEFASFLSDYRFLVGVSLDGPAALHDAGRYTVSGQVTHARVLSGIECLRRRRVEFNILTLVTQNNAARPAEVYDYLIANGFYYQQYIECVNFADSPTVAPFAIDGPEWGEFLCAIFDRWYPRDVQKVSVRLFDAILAHLVDGTANTCTHSGNCQCYFLVEHNGDIYPCDFHVQPEWRLGNLHTDSWAALWNGPRFAQFGARKTREEETRCGGCPYLAICLGDCPKNRGSDVSRRSRLCEGWQRFYRHTLPRFQELAGQIRRDREFVCCEMKRRQRLATANIVTIPGRNAPCTCGSGRKFKACCGRWLR